MEEDEAVPLQPFPDPPPFFKHFITENLKRLQEIEDEASNGADSTNDNTKAGSKLSPERILALPTELRYLIPPPPPSDEEPFHVFGETTKSSGTNKFAQDMSFIAGKLHAPPDFVLTDWTYTQLYPSSPPTSDPHSATAHIDRQAYLNRFNRSLIIEYVKLLGIIAMNPTNPGKTDVLKHILNLVCNIHALINEYRPHQARETLIRIMEEQVARKKREIEGVRVMREKVRGVLDGFGKTIEVDVSEHEGGVAKDVVRRDVESDKRKDVQRRMWDVLDEVLGH